MDWLIPVARAIEYDDRWVALGGGLLQRLDDHPLGVGVGRCSGLTGAGLVVQAVGAVRREACLPLADRRRVDT